MNDKRGSVPALLHLVLHQHSLYYMYSPITLKTPHDRIVLLTNRSVL